MSDLISRSKVISVLEQLKEQPTAYSVDKVVEELNRIRAKKTCNKEKCDTKEICRICVVDDAIEIVKQGGVFDDVCEWKYTKEIMDNAEFKVGCNPNALKRGVVPNNFSYHDFKYCISHYICFYRYNLKRLFIKLTYITNITINTYFVDIIFFC